MKGCHEAIAQLGTQAIISTRKSGARYLDAESAQPAGSKAFFPQAPQRLALRTTGADHRQAEELCCGEEANQARCRASPAQGPEQSGRTLAPTDAATRTTDAPLQISRPSSALFVGAWPDQQCLPLPAQPLDSGALRARPHAGIFYME